MIEKILTAAKERFEKKFEDALPSYAILFEFPSTVTKATGIVKKLGDEIMFFEGKYIPREHIKSLLYSIIKKEILLALSTYREDLKERIAEEQKGYTYSEGEFDGMQVVINIINETGQKK